MLQLRGVWCGKRKGSCSNYLGLARSEATLPQFLQGNIFLSLPQENQEIVLFYTFVILIRDIPVGFWLMFCMKHSWWGLCCDALLDGTSTPSSLVELQCWHRQFWILAVVVVICSDDHTGVVQYCPLHHILLQKVRSNAEASDLSWAIPCLNAPF